VTEFTKRGLPHTSIVPTLMIHNFRLVKAIDLKFGQYEAPTSLYGWRKFQLHMSFYNKGMVFQVYKIGCVWKTSFRKSGHIYCGSLPKTELWWKLTHSMIGHLCCAKWYRVCTPAVSNMALCYSSISMNGYSNIQMPRKYCTVIQETKLMHIPGCITGFKFKQIANK